eukprot:NODE_300_length_1686_cov_386.359289.p6 GENE.NODE_300_length_1686_cov_386.359289~~NODE_300_length_1686_cov_386.359289.p6  ORF type:complete len:80 (+),score=3.91 NODE_300_length_1686_cov_386.359289:1415-1654(+)
MRLNDLMPRGIQQSLSSAKAKAAANLISSESGSTRRSLTGYAVNAYLAHTCASKHWQERVLDLVYVRLVSRLKAKQQSQ